jgi:hypothetical protein
MWQLRQRLVPGVVALLAIAWTGGKEWQPSHFEFQRRTTPEKVLALAV